MQVQTSRKRLAPAPVERSATEKFRLTLYELPPTQEITLDQFERYALDRLRLLRHIETLRAKGTHGAELHEEVDKLCHLLGLHLAEKDMISHFILRLAYCRTEEQRRWFSEQEKILFRIRFNAETDENVEQFFRESDLQYQPMRDLNELRNRELKENLDSTARAFYFGAEAQMRSALPTEYFKVPFEEAIELVGKRRVYLKHGWAYVPRKDLVHIVASKFRAHLSQELSTTYRAAHNTRQDKRIRPIISTLSKRQVGPSYKPGHFSGQVTPAQIPVLAERSFPLCMQNMQQHLREDSHLKYMGRRTYGLFLKGIGLSLEDALAFWRASFAQKVPADKFNKQYAYNIRHNYGREGKRTDYAPYSCMKIINEHPGAGEHHGCPFRHFQEGQLRSKLLQRRVPVSSIEEIMRLVKGQHYQLACQRYFLATHPGVAADEIEVGNHPNKYFEESVKYYRDLEAKRSGGAAKKEEDDKSKPDLEPKPDPDREPEMPTATDTTTATATASSSSDAANAGERQDVDMGPVSSAAVPDQ